MVRYAMCPMLQVTTPASAPSWKQLSLTIALRMHKTKPLGCHKVKKLARLAVADVEGNLEGTSERPLARGKATLYTMCYNGAIGEHDTRREVLRAQS